MQNYNEKILGDLRRVAEKNRVANAYLISGGTKEDRLFAGEAFAKLLVTSPADVIRPEQEKASLFSVDDVRRTICDTAYIKPYGTGKKVYLVENASLMNVQAQNALLKTLEEPPEYVVILLLAPNAETFLPTVLSRAVKINLAEEKTPEDNEGTAELLEGLGRVLADGQDMKIEEVIALLQQYRKDQKGTAEAAKIGRRGARDVTEFIRSWFCDVLVVKLGGTESLLRHKEAESAIRDAAERLSPEQIGEILKLAEEARARTEANVSFEFSYETLFLGIARIFEARL